LAEVPAEGSVTATISFPINDSEGDHLIQVVVDPSDSITELHENNNEASKIVTYGTPSATAGNMLVTGSSPSTVYAGDLFTISGRAVYDIVVDGVRYTNYAVKGGSVEITLKDSNDNASIYGGVHTDTNGSFLKYLQAPWTTGTYRIFLTVTDKTFTGKQELVFEVVEKPESPQQPPRPPTVTGSGYWTYEASSGSTIGTWTWTWTSPPVNEPVTQTDLRAFSENVYFSENNPDTDQEITIFAEILYWATSSNSIAENVPVNLYVTYPGEPKEKFGSALIPNLSVGSPDFGSRYVYGSWKNKGAGIYIVEVEIDPSYEEENMLNNTATRAIIAGEIPNNQGAIQGQVSNPWGGVADVTIELYDSSETTLTGSTLTDGTGQYLFDGLTVGDYQVHILTPDGYVADAEIKPAEVIDQSITTVNFFLTKTEAPVADAGGPYTDDVGSEITLDASGSYDSDGEIVTYEWDCDNDGVYEVSTSTPEMSYTFDTAIYGGTISLRVTDNDGLTATDTAVVDLYLCGDLDYDGDVDGDDRNILRGAYQTEVDDAGFIEEADYDKDGDIDYSDYQLWYACYKVFIED
jgi:hypothetical protein